MHVLSIRFTLQEAWILFRLRSRGLRVAAPAQLWAVLTVGTTCSTGCHVPLARSSRPPGSACRRHVMGLTAIHTCTCADYLGQTLFLPRLSYELSYVRAGGAG